MIHPDSQLPEDAATVESTDSTRRSFLHGTIVQGAVVGGAAVLASSPGLGWAKAKKLVVAQASRAVRPSLNSPRLPYQLAPDLYRGWGRKNFQEIQADENAHVDFLVNALGANARPKPTFQGLIADSFYQFVVLSATFENVGAGAYQGAAPFLSSSYLPAAASIGFVEAFHSGFLNTLLNLPIFPTGGTPSNSFARALTFDEVAASLTPFIANLNDPNNLYPLPTALNPSTITDVNILNFALIAEYLEREFYNENVPRFYS